MQVVTTPGEDAERRQLVGRRRREQSRRRLLRAADELFRERGYAATTVTAIAERAGVAVQTLYLAWESKSALFRAAADAAVTAADVPLTATAWRDSVRDQLAEQAVDPTASSYLAAVAKIFVQVAERTAVYWRMQPAAATADPDIAESHVRAMQQRRLTIEGVARLIPGDGLRPGLTEDVVANTLWALASPEMYALFVDGAANTPAQFEHWLSETLIRALCTTPRH